MKNGNKRTEANNSLVDDFIIFLCSSRYILSKLSIQKSRNCTNIEVEKYIWLRYSRCQDQCITHQFLIEAYLFNQHCQWISSSVILLHIPLCFSPPGADPPRAVFSIRAGLLSCSRRPPPVHHSL